jgi:hypothetical protein
MGAEHITIAGRAITTAPPAASVLQGQAAAGAVLRLCRLSLAIAEHNVSVHAFVGVTDDGWYRFLAARSELTEVNFWRPSGRHAFRALQPGQPFFFKAHYPHNKIVGGGFFSGFVSMRVSDAWELLGPGNGAASLDGMRNAIARYRPTAPGEDPEIGCILIRDPRFFPYDAAMAPPPGSRATSCGARLRPCRGFSEVVFRRSS